jgi:hypothetical protein
MYHEVIIHQLLKGIFVQMAMRILINSKFVISKRGHSVHDGQQQEFSKEILFCGDY